MLIGIALSVVIVLLAAWELWICEGTHLGRRFVVWMYDVAAGRYEGIKRFDPGWEQRFLGEPLAAVLGGLPDARLLDVGAGTGRAARPLLAGLGGSLVGGQDGPARGVLPALGGGRVPALGSAALADGLRPGLGPQALAVD